MQARVFAPFFKGIALSNISGKDAHLVNLGFRPDLLRGKISDSKTGRTYRIERDDVSDSCLSLVIAVLTLESKRLARRVDEDDLYDYHALLTNLFGMEDKDAIEIEMELIDPKKYDPAWKKSIAMMISCFETEFREQILRALWRMSFMDNSVKDRATINSIANMLGYSPEDCEAIRSSAHRD